MIRLWLVRLSSPLSYIKPHDNSTTMKLQVIYNSVIYWRKNKYFQT